MVTVILLLLLLSTTVSATEYRLNGTSLNKYSEAVLVRDCRCSAHCSELEFSPTVNRNKTGTLTLEDIKNLQCIDDFARAHDVKNSSVKPIVWLYGFTAATILNTASLSGLIFAPIIKKQFFPLLLSGMISLGMGSMCTVSIINLIPTALGATEGNLKFLCVILISMFIFYLADEVLRFWQFEKNGRLCVPAILSNGNVDSDEGMTRNVRTLSQATESLPNFDSEEECIIKPINSIKDVPIIVYMILVSDGLHNFVDGLTVGASFTNDAKKAIGVVVAIFFEEIPCELGDFAVFLKAGLRVKYAVMINFAGACTNYLGVIVGILIGELPEVHLWVYAIAGGMFLYISIGIMLTEMLDIQTKIVNHAVNSSSAKNVRRSASFALLKCMAIQNFAIVIGFVLQLLIVLYATP